MKTCDSNKYGAAQGQCRNSLALKQLCAAKNLLKSTCIPILITPPTWDEDSQLKHVPCPLFSELKVFCHT